MIITVKKGDQVNKKNFKKSGLQSYDSMILLKQLRKGLVINMSKNTFALEIEYFGSCGYDYRVDTNDGETLGYLSHDEQGSWMFSTGSTPSEAKTSDPVSYEDYTISEVKEELELDFTNF